MQKIEASAFRGTGLTSIELPAALTIVWQKCFEECKTLTTIIFQTRLESLQIYQQDHHGQAPVSTKASVELFREICCLRCPPRLFIISPPKHWFLCWCNYF
jgi:hypothetical protein